MSDRELMQQALEALQSSVPTHDGFLSHCKAMNHLRIRLAQPEQELVIDCPRCGHCCPQSKPPTA
jgi:hypothetical protein